MTEPDTTRNDGVRLLCMAASSHGSLTIDEGANPMRLSLNEIIQARVGFGVAACGANVSSTAVWWQCSEGQFACSVSVNGALSRPVEDLGQQEEVLVTPPPSSLSCLAPCPLVLAPAYRQRREDGSKRS